MKVQAYLKNLRIAPRKTRLVANLIKGLDVQNALDQLDSTVKGATESMKKLLESAIANGENNFGIDKNNMYVFDVVVGEGIKMKRWMPKAFGRAGKILKRTSQITIILEEREEGKNRKSKEQMEKEKQKRIEEKKKAEKEFQEKREKEKKESGKNIDKFEKDGEEKEERESANLKKTETKKGFMGKIFRRKSM